MKNSFLQLQWTHRYQEKMGHGSMNLTMRTPFTYDYSYLQGEWVHQHSWKKLAFHWRGFARLGMGHEIPKESALFLAGGNPEEMMESKFTRSQGFIPLDWSGFSTDQFSHVHAGGGLNLRGYTGYYAIDEQAGIKYINYKGKSGASLNLEIDFDGYLPFRPKYLRDYVHLDSYLFGDAGIINRGALNTNLLSSYAPVDSWSKVRADAGIGFAFTLKKMGPLEKISPFILRLDIPFFISAPPYADPNEFDVRWIIGVGRSF